jgi:hypothetical protein
MSANQFGTVSIVGVGLVGASLGLALKHAKVVHQIVIKTKTLIKYFNNLLLINYYFQSKLHKISNKFINNNNVIFN